MEAGENPAQARCRVMNLKKSFCKDAVNPPNAIGSTPEKADDFLIESKYFPTDKKSHKNSERLFGKNFKIKRSFAIMKNLFKKIAKNFLLMALITAMSFTLSACKKEEPAETPASTTVSYNYQEIGEGEKSFTFIVYDGNGNNTIFTVYTDEKTVGDALMKVGLISGENSDYGLYVKTVNGTTLDYDTDGKYWAFYVNGEYAVSGVDTTEITEGGLYEFRAE